MNDTTQTIRQLLTRWAKVEPDLCEEFKKVFTIGTVEGYNKRVPLDDLSDFALAWIQWAVQQAIIERNWGLELDYYPGNDGWRATIKPGPRWTTGGSPNVAEALLSAYLKALEASK